MGREWDMVWVAIETVIILGIIYWVSGFFLFGFWGTLIRFGLLIGFIIFGIPYFILAPKNMWFTIVKEGTAKFVGKGGAFEACLIQWSGYTFDRSKTGVEKWNVIKGEEPRHRFGGLRLYTTNWPIVDILIYKFRWTGVSEDGKIQHKEEWLDFMLLKDDTYLAQLIAAEDKGLLPLDVDILLTIRIVNPYKARFSVQNWLETIINRIQPLLREYIAGTYFEKLVKTKQKVGQEMWQKLNEARLLAEFKRRYGVDIRAIELRQVKPPEGYVETTLKERTAKYEKKAIVVAAEAEKIRLEKVYGTIEKLGGTGKLIRTLEAVEKSPFAASLTVQAVPGLSEIFRGIFGKPAPETLSEENAKELMGLLKELRDLKSQKK